MSDREKRINKLSSLHELLSRNGPVQCGATQQAVALLLEIEIERQSREATRDAERS